MQNARLGCTGALIKVTRVLVEERWENGSSNHDVGESTSIVGA